MRLVFTAILLALPAAASAQEIERAESVSRSPSYPYELRQHVNLYNLCLSPAGARNYVRGTSAEAQHRADVERCDPELQKIVNLAIGDRSQDRNLEAARIEVTTLFADLRQFHIERGEAMDALLGQAGKPDEKGAHD